MPRETSGRVAVLAARWRLDDISGTTVPDSVGAHAGTITGLPRLGAAPLDTGTTASIDLSGSDHITIPSADALNPSAGAICGHAYLDGVAPKRTLAAKDTTRGTPGGWSVEAVEDGAGGMKARAYMRGGTNEAIVLLGANGSVPVGSAFFWALTWGPAGLTLHVGTAAGSAPTVATNPSTAGALLSNTTPLTLGAFSATIAGTRHDGLLGDVRLYNGQPDQAALDALCQPLAVSEAVADAATVKAGGSVVIPVLANDRTSGPVTALSIDSAPVRGTATADLGTGSVTFTDAAGAATEQVVSFAYSRTDDRGPKMATVAVTIAAVSQAAASQNVVDNPKAFYRVGKKYPAAILTPVNPIPFLGVYYSAPTVRNYGTYNVTSDVRAIDGSVIGPWRDQGVLALKPRNGKWYQKQRVKIGDSDTEPPTEQEYRNFYNVTGGVGIELDEFLIKDETGHDTVLEDRPMNYGTVLDALRKIKDERPDYLIAAFWSDVYTDNRFKDTTSPHGHKNSNAFRFGIPPMLVEKHASYDIGICEAYVNDYRKDYRHIRVLRHAEAIRAAGMEHKTIFAMSVGEPGIFAASTRQPGDGDATDEWAAEWHVDEQIGYWRRHLPEAVGALLFIKHPASVYEGSSWMAMHQQVLRRHFIDPAPTVVFNGPPAAVGAEHVFTATGIPNTTTASAIQRYRWFVDNECAAITTGGSARLSFPTAGTYTVTVHAVAGDWLAGADRITVTRP